MEPGMLGALFVGFQAGLRFLSNYLAQFFVNLKSSVLGGENFYTPILIPSHLDIPQPSNPGQIPLRLSGVRQLGSFPGPAAPPGWL